MTKHSDIIGGSIAARRINCPASRQLEREMPQQKTSTYMATGTALHKVMEQKLLAYPELYNVPEGTEIEGVKLNAENIRDAELAMEATLEAFKRFGIAEFEPEANVNFTDVDGAFGQCDFLGVGTNNAVVLLDYKFGYNVVSPVDNDQLLFYGTAAMLDPAFADWFTGDLDQPVILGIIQPAAMEQHGRPTALWTWETTVRRLTQFQIQVNIAVDSMAKETEPTPGSWCKYCRAAPVCPAHLQPAARVDLLKDGLLQDLTTALRLVESLTPWIKQVKSLAHETLRNGQEIEGFKLVQLATKRQWIDEAGAHKKLSNSKKLYMDDYMVKKIITAPALEKVCKQKGVDFKPFEPYIGRRSSGTKVVPADDEAEGIVVVRDREVPDVMKS